MVWPVSLTQGPQGFLFGFLREGVDEPAFVHLHDPEVGGVAGVDGDGGDGDIGAQFFVMVQHFHKIHLVELVARQDQDIVAVEGAEVAETLADGVGRSLVPGGVVGGLFRSQDIDKGRAEGAEMVGILDMPVQRRGVELGQDEHPGYSGIQAIGDRDVDEPVFSGDRNGWL